MPTWMSAMRQELANRLTAARTIGALCLQIHAQIAATEIVPESFMKETRGRSLYLSLSEALSRAAAATAPGGERLPDRRGRSPICLAPARRRNANAGLSRSPASAAEASVELRASAKNRRGP